jgi:site-specific DNA-methyltransferase (cytosine-N4-specific)
LRTTMATNQQHGGGQLDLFSAILSAYSHGDEVSNADLYKTLESTGTVSSATLCARSEIGKDKALHSPAKRSCRWIQQTLRKLGAIERVDGKRGVWRAVANAGEDLQQARPGVALLAFSTKLGLALWADCSVFKTLDEPISLILTSPPYPLSCPRAYGNPSEREFVDFICRALEPLVKSLVRGGSVALNISNDIFIKGSPERSLYVERTVIALNDRLGLHLMDRLVFENPCKPPGPTYWACRERVQLVHTYEPVLWFSNDPKACFADNRRVLRPHTDHQKKLIARGGESRTATFGDGAYSLREGSFGAQTDGSIQRNILRFPHDVGINRHAKRLAHEQGLATHAAMMPLGLAKFLIGFTTPSPSEGEQPALVADPFGGWQTTALAAEQTGRRWISTELMGQYVAGAANRFNGNPELVRGFAIT